MTASISKLPDLLINQIAAGEVVENPASCIKELVENSIDAGSTFIEIAIKSGGFVSIQIVDNGHGIKQDDVLLAFERHTTSKLHKLEDLLTHEKMGFRGEALASIASCSKVTLKTATQDGLGVVCELEGGIATSFQNTALKKGTSIEIRELFYNTPARKKFQKSAASSSSEIEKLVTTLILAHPKISFRFKSDHQIVIDAPIDPSLDFKKAFQKRIYDIFSDFDVDKGLFLDISDPLCSITGYLAPFDAHYHSRKNQFFIVNQRPVEALHLSYALSEALRTYLPEKRFFQGVFHLNIDPKWVDINIHPQKKEVKFAEEAYIKDLLKRLVTPKMPNLPKFNEHAPSSFNYAYDFSISKPQLPKEEPAFIPTYDFKKVIGYYPPYLLISSYELEELFTKSGLVLFHVKKAHETLTIQDFFQQKQPLASQGLLICESLNLTMSNKAKAIAQKTRYLSFGFDINDSAQLTAHPAELSLEASKKLFCASLDQLHLNHDEFAMYMLENICQAKTFSFEEAQKILNKVLQSPKMPLACFALVTDAKLSEIFYESHQS